VTHTHVGMGMGVNPYPLVYMGDPVGLFFCRGYGYGVVIPDGYLPIAISTHVGLVQTLLNGSCLGLARQTRHIWPYVPSHNNDGPHFNCRHLVRHPAFFSLPSCLCLHATHSRKRAWEQVPLPGPAPIPTRVVVIVCPRGRFTACVHHRFCRCRTSRSSSGIHPVLPPQPSAPAHGHSREPNDARRRGYRVSRSCSWPFSVHVAEEDIVASATHRLS
jgi:hypothetical protein